MNKKINNYIDNLFNNAPKTRRVYELKEEIKSNVNEKYYDLMSMGDDDDTAYSKAIASIGNVDGLIEENKDFIEEEKEYRRKSGIRVAIAVMMYIMSPMCVVILGSLGFGPLSVVSMFTLIALATGILIYNGYTRPRYYNSDDQLYEEFKEWKYNSQENKKEQNHILSIISTVTILIYFLVSFTFGNWHISWIIFIIGALVKKVVVAYFDLKEDKENEKL